ncbi:MAG: DUF6932 family protein [Gaiellaceae bacterium]
MSIPAFDAVTGNLPPGVHHATWSEIVTRFGWNAERKLLLAGLRRALESLKAAGCQQAYLDGSFVTEKDIPGDFDGCWEAQGVDPGQLDLVLLDFSNQRAAQKAKYGGELFIANSAATPAGTRFVDFFQQDKATGQAKGILAIDLGGFA